MTPILEWFADAILAILLTATLVMAIRLDRALRVVRRDRAVFEALITNLGSATNSVKLGIQALRNEADRAAEQIERRSEDADKLATDLSFLIEAADRAGARLELGRQMPPAEAPAQPVVETPPAPGATVGDTTSDATTQDLSSVDHPNGLRQLAGFSKRRRSRAAEPDSSAAAADAEPSRESDSFGALKAGGLR